MLCEHLLSADEVGWLTQPSATSSQGECSVVSPRRVKCSMEKGEGETEETAEGPQSKISCVLSLVVYAVFFSNFPQFSTLVATKANGDDTELKWCLFPTDSSTDLSLG